MQLRSDNSDEAIPDKEPVFVIRARDPLAHDTIMYWATRAELHNEDKEFVAKVVKFAAKTKDYEENLSALKKLKG